MITKKIQRSEELYIQFTKEEMEKLNIKPNSKFSWEINEDNSVTLKPYVSVELDLEEFSKEELISLIRGSIEENITIEEFIEKILEEALIDNEISRNNIE